MVDTNVVFSAVSMITFVLCMIPLYWHAQSWNIGTCMFILWSGLGTLVWGINSIIWHNNVIDWAPVWCDIATKFILGTSIGIPFSSMAINRRLYKISSVRAVMITRSEKRRETAIDFSLCLGVPVLVMILHYIVQGHRYDIYEDAGCEPVTYNTPAAFVLVYMWPLISGLFGAFFCIMTIYNFHKRGRQLREVLSTHSNLNSSRYIRLMLLASMELFANFPLTIYIIWRNATQYEVFPYISWYNVHVGFSHVNQYPRILWGGDPELVSGIEMQRWLTVACALVFVFFFGFADEARKHYSKAYTSIASRLGLTTVTESSFADSRFESKGVAVRISTSGPTIKRDSFMSGLSTNISLGDYDESSFVKKDDEKADSPTDTESTKFSPTDSMPSSSFAQLPHFLQAPEHAHVRPESEILVVDHPVRGAEAV
ncbi:STE3-domain-containing protein [Peniophora sp. CONT]|nr:STE3-domain-containing protein [Peniophora sp. CONT]